VCIKNFRCLQDVSVEFDSVTTLVGPNGAGKSTVLRALDWFFNGTATDLSDEDRFGGSGGLDAPIVVTVEFDRLTAADRAALGAKYAADGIDTLTVQRTWQRGNDKITGKAFAFPAFEKVRAADSASDKKAALDAAAEAHPDLGIPKWTKVAEAEFAMSEWESKNRDHLVDSTVSDSHFFGFNSKGKLSGIFDYVLVTADLRAQEETVDGRSTVVGRILERTVDRTAATEALDKIYTELATKQQKIGEEHLDQTLRDLADGLSREVEAFSAGRQITLRANVTPLKPQPIRVSVGVIDDALETTIERQGHGFQRALLIAALKLLANRGSAKGDGVIFLAIEEPELFQHPTRARVFSGVLRKLADDGSDALQVAYATHSPHFVDPRYFDQVRRITKSRLVDGDAAASTVHHASMATVCSALEGFAETNTILGFQQSSQHVEL
jgi:putative ATP-dependent endonuclease of OLD family